MENCRQAFSHSDQVDPSHPLVDTNAPIYIQPGIKTEPFDSFGCNNSSHTTERMASQIPNGLNKDSGKTHESNTSKLNHRPPTSNFEPQLGREGLLHQLSPSTPPVSPEEGKYTEFRDRYLRNFTTQIELDYMEFVVLGDNVLFLGTAVMEDVIQDEEAYEAYRQITAVRH